MKVKPGISFKFCVSIIYDFENNFISRENVQMLFFKELLFEKSKICVNRSIWRIYNFFIIIREHILHICSLIKKDFKTSFVLSWLLEQ